MMVNKPLYKGLDCDPVQLDLDLDLWEIQKMAKTKENKKKVYVHGHTKIVNKKKIKVPTHYRSTPN